MSARPSFLARFIWPLVTGGAVHVGRPLGPAALPALAAELAAEDDLVFEVAQARQAQAGSFWPFSLRLPLDEEALTLAVGLHDLLFLAHPESGRFTVRDAARALVAEQTRQLLQRPAPATPEQLVARHTLVGPLFALTRTDIVLEHWLAIYRFRGQTPAPSLTRFPRLRRVRLEQQTGSWLDPQELREEQLALLRLLLQLSPLTDFFTPRRGAPPFSWAGLAGYLRTPLLCRVVAHGYLEQGLAAVGQPLARAFWELAELRPPRAAELALVCGLVVYLFASLLFVGNPQADGEDPPAPDAALGAVLVAAADCGLLPDATVLGEQRQQLETLVGQLRRQQSPKLRAQTEALAAALGRRRRATAPGEEAA